MLRASKQCVARSTYCCCGDADDTVRSSLGRQSVAGEFEIHPDADGLGSLGRQSVADAFDIDAAPRAERVPDAPDSSRTDRSWQRSERVPRRAARLQQGYTPTLLTSRASR